MTTNSPRDAAVINAAGAESVKTRATLGTVVWRIGRLVVAAYLVMLAVLYAFQDQLIYPGAGALRGPAKPELPSGYEQVWIESEPGVRVEAWFALGRGCTTAKPGPAAMMAHGNYELIDDGDYHGDRFRELGVSVLLVEFRGYGRSGGKPTQAGITRDFLAMHDWLTKRPAVDGQRVVLYGRSLGAAAVVQVAAVHPPRAMILESPFRSLDAMAARLLVPSFLLRDHWRTEDVLRTVQPALLLIHGRQDGTIPVEHSRRLHELVAGSALLEYNGGHTDLAGGNAALYWGAVRVHLKKTGVIKE